MCQLESTTAAAIDRAIPHVQLGVSDFTEAFPYVSENLVYSNQATTDLPWSAGFWPGVLYLMDELRPDPQWREAAAGAERRLARHLAERAESLDHDIGFQYFLGSAVGYERTGDEQCKAVALRAAELYAARFNERGNFIRAHGWDGSSGVETPWETANDGPAGRFIVDSLMTVPLLYWAVSAGAPQQYLDIAREHVQTSLTYLLRADGWVYHAFELDPQTAQPIGPATLQGASVESAWGRAQAWAIYGFGLAATHLHWPELRDIARSIATKFFDNCLPTGLAPWDFTMPQGAATIPDASASAIAVSATLALTAPKNQSDADGDPLRRRALLGLAALNTEAATTNVSRGEQGLIEHSCYHYPAGRGLRESMAWGDFFYLEALAQASGRRGLYSSIASS